MSVRKGRHKEFQAQIAFSVVLKVDQVKLKGICFVVLNNN